MATLDGVIIARPATGPTSAGAFLLDRTPKHHATVDAGDDWTVELRPASKYVLARSSRAAGDYDAAQGLAFDAAQRGLDLLSVKGGNDLTVVGARVGHLARWVEDGVSVLRVVAVATLTVDVPPLRVVTTEADGNVVPDHPPAPIP